MSTAAILAGGQSKRMGFDKQVLMIGQEAIIEHQIAILEKHFDQIMIISNNHLSDRFLSHEKVVVYEDILKGYGPLGGIHSALKHAYDPYVFIVACDMPEIDEDYLLYMESQLEGYEASVTCYGDWIEPFHAFYHKALTLSIEKYLLKGYRNISSLLRQHQVNYIAESVARDYSPDWSLFDNINTKEDLMSKLNSRNA
ncbi:molybdenum cofactor guanylyltransferase [Acidaminobacter sp. JC074]|uniref:molybdenum cofactor guanylyltransferase n=1 Tax=Acidaminobacter sp. JC074 TaxID=2530199 RepID=UPI001F0D3A48|nr:molybdenum cofactor guanylyltransferase [Acidaminobacter sp. JC074]MCH4889053.1 molybdenum cofactor guanylyltransferase [Acidaminobacter sp. JC074]